MTLYNELKKDQPLVSHHLKDTEKMWNCKIKR